MNVLRGFLLLSALAFAVGCSDDDNTATIDGPPPAVDAKVFDAGETTVDAGSTEVDAAAADAP